MNPVGGEVERSWDVAEDEGGGGSRHRITEGEWAGWYSWSARDPFEALTGPYHSRLVDGEPVCAMRLEDKHMNGLGGMHGGAMMSFADFALFALSQRPRGGGPALTVNLSGDFLGSAKAGELIEARGEVTKAGASLVFVRGLVTAEAERRPVLSFTGVIKKIRPRPAA